MQAGWRAVAAAVIVVAVPLVRADTSGVEADLRKAAAAYVASYNIRDYAALADHWSERAELVEGGARISGRDAIVASIRRWLDGHPQARLELTVTEVEQVAGPVARVRGTLAFTKRAGEKPLVSRFESLRVLEGGTWRIAESFVVATHAAALDDLGWLVGTWQATDPKEETTVELTYERALGGHALVGRTTIRPKQGQAIEALDVIHADLATGTVRSWLFDSTGARAEGVFRADAGVFSRTLVGSPAADSPGSTVSWTQSIVPGGEGRFTMQSIERSIDGRPVPDKPPLHFSRR